MENEKKKVKLNFILLLAVIALIFFAALKFIEEIRAIVGGFIVSYGFFAVFIISFLSDIIMQPIGPDVPILTGILLGLPPIPTLLVAIGASGIATLLGYSLGSKFGTTGFLKFYGQQRFEKWSKMYKKYNLIVPIAAFTPVPYVPICWISGILKMKKVKFFIYAIGPRSLRLFLVMLFAVGVS
jgi:membrane protein YqaA with SNARE-associated domain